MEQTAAYSRVPSGLVVRRLITAFALLFVVVGCEGRRQQSTQVGGVTPQGPAKKPVDSGTPATPSPADQGQEQTSPGSVQPPVADVDDSGLTQAQLKEGQAYVGAWDGLQDETKRPSDAAAKWEMVNTSATNTPPTTPGGGSGGTAVTYEAEIKTLMDANCTTCHRVGGTRASSPLTTYAEAKSMGAALVSRVVGGTMPTGGLALAIRDKFKAWETGGFLERASTGTNTVGGGTVPNGTVPNGTTNPNGGVEFRIKAGTGSNPWNDKSTEVVARVNQPFTIHNDDTVPHQWHTNGSPCQHGAPIQPGKSETCTPSEAYNQGPLYDHLNEATGVFYIRAE